ncbi:putative ATP-dependent RNA helicase [Dirofilaria immitis]
MRGLPVCSVVSSTSDHSLLDFHSSCQKRFVNIFKRKKQFRFYASALGRKHSYQCSNGLCSQANFRNIINFYSIATRHFGIFSREPV